MNRETIMSKTTKRLQDEIRESLSPQAVALIVAHLQTCDGVSVAHREVSWFRKILTETVGGHKAVNDLFDEVGV